MAPQSEDPRESPESPNIEDDYGNDQSPQPSRQKTVTVPIIPQESPFSTSFDDDNNDDNDRGDDDILAI
ncbi:hypothetical protein BDD12DRAFT_880766 [Trichophaea hybrida]|nr:hypothetical protein BDD12DRAFT_880766 [Trichophaea hybrida]